MTEEQVIKCLESFKNSIIELKDKLAIKEQDIFNIKKYNEMLLSENETLKERLDAHARDDKLKDNELSKALQNVDDMSAKFSSYKLSSEEKIAELEKQINILKTESNEDDRKLLEEMRAKKDSYKEKYNKEVEHSNSLISIIENNEREFENRLNDKDAEVEKIKATYKKSTEQLTTNIKRLEKELETYKSADMTTQVVCRFGKTTKEIMKKVYDFISYLYTGTNDTDNVITLNNPEKAKKELKLSDKEVSVFIDRLKSMKAGVHPLIFEADSTLKTTFKEEWLKDYISEIV